MKAKTTLAYSLCLLGFQVMLSCEHSPFGKPHHAPPLTLFAQLNPNDDFAQYWFSGKAELNTYKLEISRYGEKRRGKAVLIFVTEDFDPVRQVKIEAEEESPEIEKVNVLKCNNIWRFTTGIYDYSLMCSTFSPTNTEQHAPALKLSMSAQDWCGQSFLQINREKSKYLIKQFSYFNNIGDQTKTLPGSTLLEDEIFNLLRLGPKTLLEGEYDLLPAAFYLQLTLKKPMPHAARIYYRSGEANPQCVVEYLHLKRTLIIEFEASFPYRILGWTEEDDQKQLVKAELLQSIQAPYWQQNKNEFEYLRDSLSLNRF